MAKKQVLQQALQSGKFGEWHHFPLMRPLKPGKDNTYAVSLYNYNTYNTYSQIMTTVYCILHIMLSTKSCPIINIPFLCVIVH